MIRHSSRFPLMLINEIGIGLDGRDVYQAPVRKWLAEALNVSSKACFSLLASSFCISHLAVHQSEINDLISSSR